MPSKYVIEFRQRAVCLLRETVPESEFAAIMHVDYRLGIAAANSGNDQAEYGMSASKSREVRFATA